MRAVPASERRARLVRRHHLRPPAADAHGGAPLDVTALAEHLVGLHATDPATPFLSARARLPGFVAADLERALFEDRTLLKHLGMRRTLFVLPTPLVPVVQAACTDAVLANERTRVARDVARRGLAADGAAWLAEAEAEALAALDELGAATGAELSRAVPALRAKVDVGSGRWGADVGVATRVLTVLAAARRIRRGPPTGGWTSSRHRWEPAPPPPPAPPEGPARAELVRRWLAAFGPATVADLAWWTGLGVTRVRTALADVGAVEVDLDGGPGVVLADDLEPVAPVEPAAALLPALDPTTMGWKERGWYLGPHGPALFDRNGNAGPTVWWDGRVVGGWAQRPDGEVVHRLLEPVGAEASAAVAAEVERLQAWLGDRVVTPRFPTPLDLELRGSAPAAGQGRSRRA